MNHTLLTLADLNGKFLVEGIVNQNLSLCDLASPYLKGEALEVFDFTSQESIDSKESAKAYKRCHEIANAIYHHSDQVDGLYWESRYLTNTYNIVIWQRDHTSTPFIHLTPEREMALSSDKGRQVILLEACRLNVPARELMK